MAGTPLPEGASGYGRYMVERWLGAPWTLLAVGLLLTLVATVLLQSLRRGQDTDGPASLDGLFVLLLAALGLALVYAPEFVYLRDNFGTRMNTVFKFYYQGWLLLGLAAAYSCVAAWRSSGRQYRGAARVLAVLSLGLMAVGLLYPLAGVYAKTGGFAAERLTFDASAYIGADELAAAAWVEAHVPLQARVLEGKGASYNASYNRMSTLTGRPTLLGWDGHEAQWRGRAYGEMARGRPEALDTVYRNGDRAAIQQVLAEWQIEYVYVGPSEIETYGISEARLGELGEAMELVFAQGPVRIFRRR
jgi:uncharacterized membrane protein